MTKLATFAAAFASLLANIQFAHAQALDIEQLSKPAFSAIEKNLELTIRGLDGLTDAAKNKLIAAVRLDPRIVGGTPARIEDNPWQVALVRGYADEPIRSQFCGGSLIGSGWVLTAAHCIHNPVVQNDPTRVDIVAGTAFYQAMGDRVEVETIATHPNWNSATMDYDFALLKLKRSPNLGAPIEVVSAGEIVPTGARAFVSGWGAIAEGDRGSDELLGVSVPIVASDVCNAPESYNGQITPSMLCAGEREGGLDSCQGDSGGPLSGEVAGKRKLIGVVSWGDGCARKAKYGIYANIEKATDWISQTAK